MGHLNNWHGRVAIEEREGGFAIHWDYEEAEDGEEKIAGQWATGHRRPEIPYSDLPDLIAALREVHRG